MRRAKFEIYRKEAVRFDMRMRAISFASDAIYYKLP